MNFDKESKSEKKMAGWGGGAGSGKVVNFDKESKFEKYGWVGGLDGCWGRVSEFNKESKFKKEIVAGVTRKLFWNPCIYIEVIDKSGWMHTLTHIRTHPYTHIHLTKIVTAMSRFTANGLHNNNIISDKPS